MKNLREFYKHLNILILAPITYFYTYMCSCGKILTRLKFVHLNEVSGKMRETESKNHRQAFPVFIKDIMYYFSELHLQNYN